MSNNKGFTIIELSISIILIIILIIGTHFYKKAEIDNQHLGAQLALMKLYETQKLYHKENNKYTSDLKILWKYHKRVPIYPVTIVDERERAIKKEKMPIKYFRIGKFKLDIKVEANNFKITATPMYEADKKNLKFIYSIDDKKNLRPQKKWTIKTDKTY